MITMPFKHYGTPERYVRQMNAVIDLATTYRAMSDEQLKSQTDIFRQQLAEGKSLDSIKIAAYAVIREADLRVLGMFPFDVQVLGALVMQDGNVAEMMTGEGKTLTATMPMYLNGLTGSGNFLVTANEYLAYRDAQEMGRVYRWLGLTAVAGVAPAGGDPHDRDLQKIYQADIVYTTNSTLGFDYLMDNLSGNASDRFLQGFHYALLDEIDAVLLDSAQMPLIISGAPRVRSNLFGIADQVICLLRSEIDFERSNDHKKVWFTPQGIDHMEEYLGLDGLLTEKHRTLYRHLVLALKAHQTLTRDRDYVVDADGVSLLDLSNGRKLAGMKLEAGLHQALEAKELVQVTNQTRTMASITFQNLFRMFSHLSGMTGTAKTDAAELQETYRLSVIPIPTNKHTQRIDHPDKLYGTTAEKLDGAVKLVKKAYKAERPVLIETGSVSLSNLLSRILLSEEIPHNLLNARSAAKEALIVKEAGQPGAITVATSMAGRGTDIKLGKGVKEKGGLLVIGTERMNSARVDNQLRGRAGRQGAPGETVFLVSIEDSILLEHGPKWLRRYRRRAQAYKEAHPGAANPRVRMPFWGKFRFRRLITQAQHNAEKEDRQSRTQTLQYAEIMRVQRDTVYDTRKLIMTQPDLAPMLTSVFQMATNAFLAEHPEPTRSQLADFVLNTVDSHLVIADVIDQNWDPNHPQGTAAFLQQLMVDQLAQKFADMNDDQQTYFERMCLLKSLDNAWIDQVDMLQQLRQIATNRSTAQHDPLLEYLKDGRKAFGEMKQTFARQAVQNLLLSEFQFKTDGSIDVTYP